VDGAKSSEELDQENARTAARAMHKYTPKQDDEVISPKQLLDMFRDKLKARGARGIIGIQRLFKIIDDDGSRTLNQQEFAKACRDFKIGLSDENIPILFKYFDSNRDGCLNIDEFLLAIRGDLNEKRLALVQQAF